MTDPINLQQLRTHTVVADNGCHLWTSAIQSHGYGTTKVDGRTHHAHRVVYALHHGPIPDGIEIHHLCNERRCVNIDHLAPVTSADHRRIHNVFEPTWQARAARTHCKNGHEFTPENTRSRPDNGGRVCRACKRDAFHRRKAKRSP